VIPTVHTLVDGFYTGTLRRGLKAL